MKKITIKNKFRKNKAATTPARITNETVAEHREQILAGGRKFKYPHQYVRHKLVINATIIGVVALILVVVLSWLALYKLQNTGELMYRVTRIVPVPVADVNGESVRYSDYLMRYRSQEVWLRDKGQLGVSDEDDKRQFDFFKRAVLDGLEKDMYAQQRARELGITVSDQEVQALIDSNRQTASGEISQEVYDASTKDTLGYSPAEYRHIIKQSLLRQKVAFAVDTKATEVKGRVEAALAGKNARTALQQVQKSLKDRGIAVEFGTSGLVPRNNQDGGLTKATLALKDNEISSAVQSTTADGYYFVQRLSGNDRQVSYQYIRVPLSVFDQDFAAIEKGGKIHEHISVARPAS